ncbi:uncharacterized protein LOC110466097 [Mizuhopecten yessoensis]|uniref:Superoxide dismutase [Cu-Zn] n=1 Tax=Mizuhopecten yessoensis TaxID=6573 RepID=A0A210PQ25_MIZYE|nr:uncharacterized protein LOC110466097 [Mizuhopecten yessoensis]OWF38583.1 Superoxide dismutase [Cu-Zn] [Mizuhopecten yessoensis]
MRKMERKTVIYLCMCVVLILKYSNGQPFPNQQFGQQNNGQFGPVAAGQFVGNGQPFAGNNQVPPTNNQGTFTNNQTPPVGTQTGGTFNNNQQGTFPTNQQGTFPTNQQGTFPTNQQGTFPTNQQGTFPNNQQQGQFPNNQQQGQFPNTFQGNQFGQPGGIPNFAGPNTQPPFNFQNNVVGFQNPIGGFNTVGNQFGNPFIPGNNFGAGGPFGIGPGIPGPIQGPEQGGPGGQFSLGGQLFMSLSQNPMNYRYATCRFNSSDTNIAGRADLRQFVFGDFPVDIRIQVWGLPRSPVDTQRGIHIHEFGDVGAKCSRVGPHLNPAQTRHGGRNTFAFLRHVGDLGNMLQSPQGVTSTQFRDGVISLQGPTSVIGRSLVIKYERDDEGFGTNVDSLQNGNARTPLACCTLARSGPANWNDPYTEVELMSLNGGSAPLQGTFGAPSSPTGANTFGNQGNQGSTFNFNSQGNFGTPAPSPNPQGAGGSSFGFLGNNGKK